MEYNKNSSLISPSGQSGQFQLILSDDESLEDHSGLEDFQGVTLQINESESITPENNDCHSNNVQDASWHEAAVLSSTSTCMNSNKAHNDSTNYVNVNGGTSTNSVPQISITPISPESPSADHGNMLTQSPFQSKGYQVSSNSVSQSTNHHQSPMPPTTEDEAQTFFVSRNFIIQQAIDDSMSLADSSIDGEIRGTWLFTEIDHFDMEKERIILLCSKSLVIVKYNFIAMKQEQYRRIFLNVVDKIIQGELVYPEGALTPRIGGVAGGILGVVKDCILPILPRVQDTVLSVVGNVLYRTKSSTPVDADTQNQGNDCKQPDTCATVDSEAQKPAVQTSPLSLENFEPRTRNVHGIRIMWNQDVPLSFTTKWNPFVSPKCIPWITLTSHPLLWHKGGGGGGITESFDIDSFSRELIDILGGGDGSGDSSPMCRVEYKAIVIETNLTALFHNANSLGFYKVRGKLSF